MIPELGYAATVVAFVLALYGAIAAVVGVRTGQANWLRTGERAAVGVWLLITACIAFMLYAFLTFDFSVRYVAVNTNRGTPFYYRITALWGALEGSIVLWAWMLSIYTLIVVVRYRRRQPELYPWVLSVMLGILAFFLLVMSVPAPPFERLSPIPPDERGLHALAHGHGLPALGDDPVAPPHAQALEPDPDHPDLQPHAVRDISHALGHHRLGPLFHAGVHRRLLPGLPGPGPAGRFFAPRVADGPAAGPGRARLGGLARVRLPPEQPLSDRGHLHRFLRDRLSAALGSRARRQGQRGRALLQPREYPDLHGPSLPHVGGPSHRLSPRLRREPETELPQACPGRHRRRGGNETARGGQCPRAHGHGPRGLRREHHRPRLRAGRPRPPTERRWVGDGHLGS